MHRLFLLIVCAVIITACASSHVLIGKQRTPIDASQVKVYVDAPAKYEKVALIDASSKASFAIGDQGKMDKVISRLKEEAASLGANGILIDGLGEKTIGGVGTGFGTAANGFGVGTGVTAGIEHKMGHGMAIFVIQE